MDSPSILCSACSKIFQGENVTEILQGRAEEFSLHNHHLKFGSFSDAVRSKCYICNIIWDRHRFQDRSDTRSDFTWAVYCWNEGGPEDVSPSFTIILGTLDHPQVSKQVDFSLINLQGLLSLAGFYILRTDTYYQKPSSGCSSPSSLPLQVRHPAPVSVSLIAGICHAGPCTNPVIN
jgi:hypothetical protein